MAAAETSVDIGKTYGALLLGAGIAFSLSGVVATQCIVYFKQYPGDSNTKKAMVLVSWILDGLHSSFLMYTVHEYFIRFFGDLTRIDYIPWALAVSVVITVSSSDPPRSLVSIPRWMTSAQSLRVPVQLLRAQDLPIERKKLADNHSHRLVSDRSVMLSVYNNCQYTMFTTGLSLTAAVDILITFWLCYFLAQFRAGISPMSTMMIRMVDTLTLYTLENGALTCFAAIASLACWLTMPHNLIFIGLHFVISKLYANSFLASLNMRHQLRQIHGLDPPSGYPSGYYRNPGKGRQGRDPLSRISSSRTADLIITPQQSSPWTTEYTSKDPKTCNLLISVDSDGQVTPRLSSSGQRARTTGMSLPGVPSLLSSVGECGSRVQLQPPSFQSTVRRVKCKCSVDSTAIKRAVTVLHSDHHLFLLAAGNNEAIYPGAFTFQNV
ncbi:hypothetical protein NMY22_g3330 [Coprinellus aureogranulatus]|nr:hypothetical protein NMY22_g3330 [Coprinellus aureogranulatus]